MDNVFFRINKNGHFLSDWYALHWRYVYVRRYRAQTNLMVLCTTQGKRMVFLVKDRRPGVEMPSSSLALNASKFPIHCIRWMTSYRWICFKLCVENIMAYLHSSITWLHLKTFLVKHLKDHGHVSWSGHQISSVTIAQSQAVTDALKKMKRPLRTCLWHRYR
jgi:hypothetical protein